MAKQSGDVSFEEWLSDLFLVNDIDAEVYLSYVLGILSEDEEMEDDLAASLEETLAGAMDDSNSIDTSSLCQQIVQKWSSTHRVCKSEDTKNVQKDSEAILTRLYEESLDSQKCQLKENPSSKPATIQNKLTEEEKRRMVVLYGNQSEEECDIDLDDGDDQDRLTKCLKSLEAKPNAQLVEEQQKAHREKLKQDHTARVERDKQSRQKQLQKEQERKDREKKRTQKQERRR